MKYFVDTNIFARLYEGQTESENWIRQIQGAMDVEIVVPSIVIEEIVWLLGKFYKCEKSEIISFVDAIMGMSNIKIKYVYEMNRSIRLFQKLNVKFNDCVIVSAMNEEGTIVSNDCDFDRFQGIKRIEPKDLLKK